MLTPRPLLFALFVALSVSVAAQTHGGTHGGMTTNPRTGGAPVAGNGVPAPLMMSSADDEPKVEFRSESVLIQVPVVVSDKSGKHLHGLSKEEFSLFENGKQQNISTFEELTASNSQLSAPAAPAGQFRNLSLDGAQPRNIVVIALDTVNTPFLDQTNGRRELIKFLANNVDSGQVLALMLITSHGLRVVQGLTGDPEHLVEALKKASGEMPAVSADAQTAITGDMSSQLDSFVQYGDIVETQFLQQNAIETTMNAFLGIASSLQGVPGRKSLIWATGGFPFSMASPATVPGGYLSVLYERTMLALSQAEISIYPVDIRGLVNTSIFAGGKQSRATTGPNAIRQLNNRVWLQQSKIDTLNDFADMTGGKAYYNTNDLAGSFKRAAEDGASYYLVGYYLDTHNNKPGWRKLHVKVDKKDIEIHSRSGFFVTNATMNPLISRQLDINNALRSPIEGTGVPIVVKWLSVSTDGDKRKAMFMAQMPAGSLTFDPAGRDQLNFDVVALATDDKDGKEAGHAMQTYAKPVPPEQLASVKANGVLFRDILELAPGKYTVRFVVRDNVTGKVGSVTAPLTVN